jgi:hypothetical protein
LFESLVFQQTCRDCSLLFLDIISLYAKFSSCGRKWCFSAKNFSIRLYAELRRRIEEEVIMKLQEAQAMAKAKGIRVGNQKDQALIIREIQMAEGNFPCYGTATSGDCDQARCLWRKDCLSLTKR